MEKCARIERKRLVGVFLALPRSVWQKRKKTLVFPSRENLAHITAHWRTLPPVNAHLSRLGTRRPHVECDPSHIRRQKDGSGRPLKPKAAAAMTFLAVMAAVWHKKGRGCYPAVDCIPLISLFFCNQAGSIEMELRTQNRQDAEPQRFRKLSN